MQIPGSTNFTEQYTKLKDLLDTQDIKTEDVEDYVVQNNIFYDNDNSYTGQNQKKFLAGCTYALAYKLLTNNQSIGTNLGGRLHLIDNAFKELNLFNFLPKPREGDRQCDIQKQTEKQIEQIKHYKKLFLDGFAAGGGITLKVHSKWATTSAWESHYFTGFSANDTARAFIYDALDPRTLGLLIFNPKLLKSEEATPFRAYFYASLTFFILVCTAAILASLITCVTTPLLIPLFANIICFQIAPSLITTAIFMSFTIEILKNFITVHTNRLTIEDKDAKVNALQGDSIVQLKPEMPKLNIFDTSKKYLDLLVQVKLSDGIQKEKVDSPALQKYLQEKYNSWRLTSHQISSPTYQRFLEKMKSSQIFISSSV